MGEDLCPVASKLFWLPLDIGWGEEEGEFKNIISISTVSLI